MSNSIVATVYSGVIRDVIDNVRKDFDENGVDVSVLGELEKLWEQKIRNAKVATWEANGLTGEDHNQNNQNMNGGSSNSAHYMQQQSLQQIQAQNDPNLKYQQPRDLQAAASLPSLAVNNMHTNHNNEGRPQPYIKNGNIQLTAQSSPTSFPTSSDISNSTPINNQADDQKIYHQHHQNLHTMMVQQDEFGNPLSEKLIPRGGGENSANSSPLPEFTTRSEPSFVDNDDINSDLDDTDDEETNAEGEETQNIILCLYDKVTRTKNKWKCQLKDGIMSVNGRDYLFQKGNGDFEF
ncbi:transcription factor IIA, alpha/beta subunit [Rhizophagus irregularis]|uniref:Transcription factor IIA, alpha/beta subunit n=1 Tax=Rhizophagus irregularis TaxID=588596 RepID=A0A2I1FYB3_9GLOM|nr:transcription factor IIA, alpha/beta subunit [Rhizophagus irregularis]